MAQVTIIGGNKKTGTDNTVFFDFTFDANLIQYTESFHVRWWYTISNANTGDLGQYEDGDETVDINAALIDYGKWRIEHTPSVDKWVKVTVRIWPNSKTYTSNDTEMLYYTATAVSSSISYDATSPAGSETPTLTYAGTASGGTMLMASVQVEDERVDQVEFQIRQLTNAGIPGSIFRTINVSVMNGQSSCNFTVPDGTGYVVRCRFKNTSAGGYGISDWSDYSNAVYARPSAPTGLTAKAASDTSIKLSWKTSDSTMFENASAVDHFEINYSDEVGDLNDDGTGGSTAQTSGPETTYTIAGLEEGSMYYFQVRAINDSGESGWSNIASTVLGSPPNAPTTWSSTTTAIIGDPLNLYWVHNSEDGSDCRKSEVELSVNGTISTVTVTNPEVDDDDPVTQTYAVDTTNYEDNTKLIWRVRTAGVTGEYGEWSIKRTVTVYARPTIAIDMLNSADESIEVVSAYPVKIVGDPAPSSQTPIGYSITIVSRSEYDTLNDVGQSIHVGIGQTIFSTYIASNGEDLSYQLMPGDAYLESTMDYTLNVSVAMDSGLSAENSLNFSVQWDIPEYNLDAKMSLDKQYYSMYIVPYCRNKDDNQLTENVTMSVYRREYDGGYTLIQDNITNNDFTALIDPHPSLKTASYRLVARDTSTGAITFYDTPGYPVNGDSVVIQWDDEWVEFDASQPDRLYPQPYQGSVIMIPWNIDIQEAVTPDSVMVNYIGREDPVSYYGTSVSTTSTWNVEVPKYDYELLFQIRRLSKWKGDVYVREPSGSGYNANITITFNRDHLEVIMPITFTVTKVSGGV